MKILEFYKNKDDVNLNSFKILDFIQTGAQPGNNWLVILPAKEIRSTLANAYLWYCYNLISDHTGFTPEEIHLYCKKEFLGYAEKKCRDVATGEIIIEKTLRSTAILSKSEFADYTGKVKRLGNEQGVTFDEFEHYIASNPDAVEQYAKKYIYDKV